MPPDVGLVKGLPVGSSCRVTLQVARSGSPFSLKRVYLAATLFTLPVNLSFPHSSTTNGADGFFCCLVFTRGEQQKNSCVDRLDQLVGAALVWVASRNSSKVSSALLAPLNSGMAVLSALVDGLWSHCRRLRDRVLLGVELDLELLDVGPLLAWPCWHGGRW